MPPSPPVRVDLHLTGDQIAIVDMVRFARDGEQAGLGGVWTAEAWRNGLVIAAALAASTSSVRIGTNVVQWTRTVPTLELGAADLNEYSGGRFTLGIGTGPKEWNENWHGLSYERPVQRMREYVQALRLAWTAGLANPVSFDGEFFELRDYTRLGGPLERPVPIHLGVTLVGMAQLAGEIADGINYNVVLSAPYIREVMQPAVETGLVRAGRDPGQLERGVLVSTAVSTDRAQAYRWAKCQLAFYVGVATYFEPVMRLHGFQDDWAAARDAFHAGDPFRAADLITDAMVDELVLAGTPDEVRGKLERYAGSVDFVMIYAPTFLLGRDEVVAEHEAMIAAFAR